MTPNFRVARLVHNQAGAANTSIIWQCTRLKDSFTFSQNGVASSQISQEGLRELSKPGNTLVKLALPRWRETASPSTRRKSVVSARSRPSLSRSEERRVRERV